MRRAARTFVTFICLSQSAFANVSDADIASCHATPHANCLAEIGADFASRQPPFEGGPSGGHLLAQLGLLDAARAVELRFQRAKGQPESTANAQADYFIAPFRLIEALRNGASLAEAEAETGLSGLAVFTAMGRLSGMMATNTSLPLQPATDEETRLIVRRVAPQLGERRDQRLLAAEILAYIGEDDAALAIIETLPADDSSRTMISGELASIIGHERVLKIYEGMADVPPFYIVWLADSANDDETARRLMEDAMSRAAALPDEKDRARTLQSLATSSAKRGLGDIAGQAADLLRDIFRTTSEPDELDPTWLLAALGAIDAPLVEQWAALEQARRAAERLPEHFNGLASENLADDYLRLGDPDTAIKLFQRSSPNPRDWARLMKAEIPDDARTQMLAYLEKTLSSEEMLQFRARRTAYHAANATTRREKEAVSSSLAELISGPVPNRLGIGRFYFDYLLRAAHDIDDKALVNRILTKSARDALDDGHAWPILQAAYQDRYFDRLARND